MKAEEILGAIIESEQNKDRLNSEATITTINVLIEACIRKNDLLKQVAIALKHTGTCKAIVAAIEKELNPR